jgi:DNA-binding transcriptional regulator YiaG
METKKVLSRENKPTNEISAMAVKFFRGIKLEYPEVYYLDHEVNEATGMINKELFVKHYTKNQLERNLKALKNAYLIAKGAAAPSEILEFRTRYKISASVFSIILGFSKNTISNIENDGITSLSTGRLIKMCLNDKAVLQQYIQLCDSIDKPKKEELSKRLLEEIV